MTDGVPVIVDGGDTGCGELLMRLAIQVRQSPPGTVIRLVANDPAAPIDLPAWCHLTGHKYLGATTHHGRTAYDLLLTEHARPTHPDQSWRVTKSPHREDFP